MSRGKNCLPTVSRQFLTRNYPRPNCLLKCLPNCLSPTGDGILSSFKITPAVRVIARQLRGKNCPGEIFAPGHQDVSQGPLRFDSNLLRSGESWPKSGENWLKLLKVAWLFCPEGGAKQHLKIPLKLTPNNSRGMIFGVIATMSRDQLRNRSLRDLWSQELRKLAKLNMEESEISAAANYAK